MECFIPNEYGKLKAVLVHRPGRAIHNLSPDNMREFLFDDLPFLDFAVKEHDSLVGKLVTKGARVFFLDNELEEVIKDSSIKEDLLTKCLELEKAPEVHSSMMNLNDKTFVDVLLGGLTFTQALDVFGSNFDGHEKFKESEFVINPVPNSYFTRDPAAVVGHSVVSSRFQYQGRRRESLLAKAIFACHPELGNSHFIFAGEGSGSSDKEATTIEGGDILVLNEKTLLVGVGERTNQAAIKKLSQGMFSDTNSKWEKCYEIQLPPVRSYMHLDTVFTILDRDLVLAHPPVFKSDEVKIRMWTPENVESGGEDLSLSFYDLLKQEIPNLTIVETAGGAENAVKREQWSDGTNVVCLAPRVVIAYEHNRYTNRALRENGVEVLELDGRELVRGRGGPRCMTMPLLRETD